MQIIVATRTSFDKFCQYLMNTSVWRLVTTPQRICGLIETVMLWQLVSKNVMFWWKEYYQMIESVIVASYIKDRTDDLLSPPYF